MRVALVLALLTLSGCLAAPPQESTPLGPPTSDVPEGPAPGGIFALPAAEVSGGAEPSILVTQDGAVWIGDTSGLVKSEDDGATWESVDIGFISGAFTDGWALAEDDAGAVYVAVTNGQLISMARSTDGGDTWSVNHAVDASTLADRQWIAARGAGEVAIVYNDLKTTRELCLHSTDGGQTFLTRSVGLQASPNAGNVVFGPEGDLYYSTGNIVYRWAVPCVGEPTRLLQGDAGAQIFTQVQVDENGDIFVAKPTKDNSAMQLLGTHGMSGRTRRTLVVSPPESASNTFGTLSVQDGEIAVSWYGSSTAGNPSAAGFGGTWHVHLARVTDFWGTPVVERELVSAEPNHVGNFCMGGIGCTSGDRDLLDYFMVDHAPDGAVHVAYGHDGTGSNARVRHARLP
jgi:hypothetical protein